MKFFFFLQILIFASLQNSAQIVQSVQGTVLDKESKLGIQNVSVRVFNKSIDMGIGSDTNGDFKIEKVPVGSYTIQFSAVGYKPYTISDLRVTSAKEVVQNAELEDATLNLKAVQISYKRKISNEMAVVSVKQFDVQETERYAGSRGDPARMASNFAGVQGADDSRNDIIIRGN